MAAGIGLAWAAIFLWWVLHGGCSRQTIDFEYATPLRADFRVDVNSADWPEIAQLPGVGETLARRIVAFRRENGPFTRPEDLLKVPGLGLKTLTKLRPYFSFSGESENRPHEGDRGESDDRFDAG